MDNKIKSVLEMSELFFPSYSLILKEPIKEKTQYAYSFSIEYAERKDNKNITRVQVSTKITDNEEKMELNLETVAFFKLDNQGEKIAEKTAEQILKKNTVAIMFPFIRSQISLLTTQPGLIPIVMPPININALVDDMQEPKEKKAE